MTTEQKAKAYDEALERAKKWYNPTDADLYTCVAESIFPELKEPKNKRIREALIYHYQGDGCLCTNEYRIDYKDIRSWLEKQGEQKSTTIDVDKMVSDYASHNEKRNEIFGKPVPCMVRAYKQGICDTLESLGEEKPFKKEFTFKSIPRLLDMIEPTGRAKSYCKKLIDSLQTEGYSVDAKIVGECLKQMNGEKVAMAVMDNEKQDEKKSQRMVSAEAKEALYDKPAWSEEDMKEALRTEYEKGRADTIAEMKKDYSEDYERNELQISTGDHVEGY